MQSGKLPTILVTNDDGVEALGLRMLAAALSGSAKVVICAPAQQQSAMGHAITLDRPLRLEEIAPSTYAVNGTPADAAFVGIVELCGGHPDLVISGINHGPNLGTMVYYSGTVAAALEAALHGIPAIAVSQTLPALERPPRKAGAGAPDGNVAEDLSEERTAGWRPALNHTAEFVAKLAANICTGGALPERVFLNINGPAQLSRRFAWTKLSVSPFRGRLERRYDLRGIPYYWVGSPNTPQDEAKGSDVHAVSRGLFSITPLSLDWPAPVEPSLGWNIDGFSCERGGDLAQLNP